MKRRKLATTLATAAALTLAAPAWAGYVFSFAALPNPANVGEAVTVDVMLANDPYGLNFLGFDLQFNSSVLQFQGAGTGALSSGWDFISNASTVGSVTTLSTLLSDLTLADAFGDGSIATFAFTALAAGTADLNLDNIFLDSGSAFVAGVAPSGFSATAGSVTVQNPVTNGVPAPATLLLAGLGLALLAATRRRGSVRPAP